MKNAIIISAILVLLISGAYYFLNKPQSGGMGMSGPKDTGGVIPRVAVSDQSIASGEVVVSEIVSPADAWIVIQTNDGGIPGPIIGYAAIKAGTNDNVKIQIDKSQATASLHAMIHEDKDRVGQMDFPGEDMPLMYKNEMVTKIFNVL